MYITLIYQSLLQSAYKKKVAEADAWSGYFAGGAYV